MIKLGEIQTLKVIREADFGVFLGCEDEDEVVLLPKKQVPRGTNIGDDIEVFVYKDSEDRDIATTRTPKIVIGDLAVLKVVDYTKIGAFLDWGLEKDLFLPFKQQVDSIAVGNSYLVGLYVDKQGRLCATMKVYDLLSCESPYKDNDMVKGTVIKLSTIGAFVAVDNKYQGLILNKELFGTPKVGDEVEVRIKKVREDGKLELSLRMPTKKQIEVDAKIILDKIDSNFGTLYLNDSSDPEDIKRELAMSKGAFKRAVGRLLKEGAIKFVDGGIEKAW
ncbi:MAG: S1-like domain-containing RNA-binding protein [Clostridium sp.]|uniref:CvfB family protein n=1 Tax=Clostridium sp. TaxID=1506 RepID=UPI002FC6A334